MSGGGAIFNVDGDAETEKPPPPLKIVKKSSEKLELEDNFTSVCPSLQPAGIAKVPFQCPSESVSVEEEVSEGALVTPFGGVRVTVTVSEIAKLCASIAIVSPISAEVTFIVINGVLESPTVILISKNSYNVSPPAPVETSTASM